MENNGHFGNHPFELHFEQYEALLVMAETLLWRSYCEQRGLTYHFEPSYGISLLIMAVFGVIAAGIKVQSYVHRLRLPDEWHFPWSPGNIAVIMAMLTTKCIYTVSLLSVLEFVQYVTYNMQCWLTLNRNINS